MRETLKWVKGFFEMNPKFGRRSQQDTPPKPIEERGLEPAASQTQALPAEASGQLSVENSGQELIGGAPKQGNAAEEPVVDGPAEGYDLVVPSQDAVLHCGLLIHRAVEALNDAFNEHTIDWETNRVSVCAGVLRLVAKGGIETPEDNHQAWMDFKTKEGWVYGETKDAVAKTHPCMVPYAALPPIQKSKDMIFSAIVRAYFGLTDGSEPETLEEMDADLKENA